MASSILEHKKEEDGLSILLGKHEGMETTFISGYSPNPSNYDNLLSLLDTELVVHSSSPAVSSQKLTILRFD